MWYKVPWCYHYNFPQRPSLRFVPPQFEVCHKSNKVRWCQADVSWHLVSIISVWISLNIRRFPSITLYYPSCFVYFTRWKPSSSCWFICYSLIQPVTMVTARGCFVWSFYFILLSESQRCLYSILKFCWKKFQMFFYFCIIKIWLGKQIFMVQFWQNLIKIAIMLMVFRNELKQILLTMTH